jgi:peptidoglycan/LPS O-acetylase OafA/YrhL
MNFAFAVIIYLIFLVVFLWAFTRYGMGWFSGLTVSVLLSAVILLAILPPSEIEHQIDLYCKDKPHKSANNWIVAIYLIIMILSLIIISAYILYKAFEDKIRRCDALGDDYNADFKEYFALW